MDNNCPLHKVQVELGFLSWKPGKCTRQWLRQDSAHEQSFRAFRSFMKPARQVLLPPSMQWLRKEHAPDLKHRAALLRTTNECTPRDERKTCHGTMLDERKSKTTVRVLSHPACAPYRRVRDPETSLLPRIKWRQNGPSDRGEKTVKFSHISPQKN